MTDIMTCWPKQHCLYSYPQWQICQLDCDITSNRGKNYIWLFSREDILSHLLQFLQHEATRSTITPTPDGWPVQHRVTHLKSSPPKIFQASKKKMQRPCQSLVSQPAPFILSPLHSMYTWLPSPLNLKVE